MPVVSICLPVYNQSELLFDALCGVASQEFEDWEVLLVDYGSTEDIQAVLRRFNPEKVKGRF